MGKSRTIRFLIGYILLLALIGCNNKQPQVEDRVNDYFTDWENADYEQMYKQLTRNSQEMISKEAFIERYENIYSGIQAENVTLKALFPEDGEIVDDESEEVVLDYEMSMDTLAGPIRYKDTISFIKEEVEDGDRWAIDWDPSLIFPSMESGDEVRVTRLRAERGEIIDRNGEGLAINGKALTIGIVPERLPENADESKEQLATILGIEVETIDQQLTASWVESHMFVPVLTIAQDDERLDSLLQLTGVTYVEVDTRVYPHKEATAHLIGYLQELSEEELRAKAKEGYTLGDKIGKSGLEQEFEERLRGKDGGRIYIIDQHGEEKEEIIKTAAIDGETIQLTIDVQLQKKIYKQLADDVGTAAAIDPTSGEVLSLVSSPAYDPNEFILGLSNEKWQTLNENPDKPLVNRFAQTFAPGSVFKPITGAIALEKGDLTPSSTININGLTWQKDSSWGNYFVKRVSENNTPVNLESALIYSDNIFFAQTALSIGEEEFISGAEQFGFGERLPVEFPIKTSQLVNDHFENEIQLADTGYGQGAVEMSILHTAISYTPFLNNGNLLAPKLVKEKGENQAKVWNSNVVSPANASLIHESLRQVIENPDGTGSAGKVPGRQLAGKTGTAELKMSQTEQGKENGWFVCYDSEQQDLLIAMLIEGVEERGGSSYVVDKVRPLFLE